MGQGYKTSYPAPVMYFLQKTVPPKGFHTAPPTGDEVLKHKT